MSFHKSRLSNVCVIFQIISLKSFKNIPLLKPNEMLLICQLANRKRWSLVHSGNVLVDWNDYTHSLLHLHLSDAFIQSDLHWIQVTVSTFYQLLLSLGIEPMILALLVPCSTSWATGKFVLNKMWITEMHEIFTNLFIILFSLCLILLMLCIVVSLFI